jgi:sugar lactone lactonase YvrE
MNIHTFGLAGSRRLALVCLVALILGSIAHAPRPLQAASLDTIADRVLGQSNFTSNTPGAGAAGLHYPMGAAIDENSGRLYLADTQNHRVLSWPDAATFTNGQVADIVIGQADFNSTQENQGNMLPSATSLAYPMGTAVDNNGNLFVSDSNNGRVLAYTAPITTGMAASRVFGQPDFTTRDGPAPPTANRFNFPVGIAVDGGGNLYVTDYNNNRVLEFDAALTSDATADRVFGPPDFTSRDYSLYLPEGVAVDDTGNLYIADTSHNRVLEYDTPPLTDTIADRVFGQPNFAGTAVNSGGISAISLYSPMGIAIDSRDNLYIADTNNNRVLQYDNPLIGDTTADLVFGQPDFTSNTNNNGGVSAQSLAWPLSVAIGAGDHLYVVEQGNHRLLAYDKPVPDADLAITRMNPLEVAAGGSDFLLTVEGTRFASGATVRWNGADRPTAMVSPSRLVAQIHTADIAAMGVISVTVANTSGGVSAPHKLAIYNPTPADTVADRVLGQPSRTSDVPKYDGGRANGMYYPVGAAVSPGSGRLFIADTLNHRVLSWPSATEFTNGQAADVVIGQPNFAVHAANQAGPVGANTLDTPADVAVDTQGNLYISDSHNHRVLAYTAPITSGMAASLVFGQPNFTSNLRNNGGVSANSLNTPWGIAIDGQSNLFVADGNSRLLEYDAPLATNTTADRVFGQPDFTSSTSNNGGISANSLNRPTDIAFDSAGNLFVADDYNSRVLEYNTPWSSDTTADGVFGQPNFTSNTPNNGGISASSLDHPESIALDSAGNLFVADNYNTRVLGYAAPLANDTTADLVFGQAGFTSRIPNHNGINASGLSGPTGVAVDGAGNLLVADSNNNRVLEYDSPFADPALTLVSISPNTAIAGRAPLTLTVDGTGFDAGAVVRWNGVPLSTTLISSIQLTAQIDADDITSAGVVSVTVSNPPPDSQMSSALSFTINNPAPILNGLSHANALAGSPGFTLTVTGTNFVNGSVVRWNGADRPTTVVSSTRLTAAISTADLAVAGTATISVHNPAPGGGASNTQTFTIRPKYPVYLPLVAR